MVPKQVRQWAGRQLINTLQLLPRSALALIKEQLEVIGELDYANHNIRLAIDSRVELTTRLNSCKKEPETVKWIETMIRPGDVVYDVGANVGAYSLVIDRSGKGSCRVYCFEPNALNWHKLNYNISLNGAQGRLIALPLALSNTTSIERFSISNFKAGSALHQLAGPDKAAAGSLSQTALAMRLDDAIRLFSLPMPNHIKIDVDGHELQVLEGALTILSAPRFRSAMVEVDDVGENQARVLEFMERLGFRRGERHVHSASANRFGNFLFVR